MKIKIGCVAIGHKDRIAVLTHKEKTTWHGIGFDGKPWQCKDPAWMADDIAEVISNLKKYKGM